MNNKAIKFRLYPKKEQITLFCKTFGCCRKTWNLMLADKIRHYAETGKALHNTPAQYKDKYPYLKEADSLALANVQLNLETAYRNFFRDPKHVGFPKFKSKKHSKRAYTTNCVNGNIAIVHDNDGRGVGIKLPKLGIVKAKIHRAPDESWTLKSVTVSQDPDGRWYASVLFEYEHRAVTISIDTDNAIGLDYKSDGLFMTSEGTVGSQHKYLRESEGRLAKEQKRLSRKVLGSNNYNKQKVKVAKVHKHISNKRKDTLHKLSTEIANRYDIVCVESLNMRNMANRSFHNGKAAMDNGYGMFISMLEYKQVDRDHIFVKVDKWYPSSQLCSCCGARQKLLLSERTYRCIACGTVIDRDLNAARNIKAEGLRVLTEADAA